MNSNQKSPLYFNLQSVRPYNQDSNVAADVNFKPGQINIFNDTPFLKDSDQYYVGVQRALIPVSYVPRLIVPVVLGPVDNGPINTNPDLLVYKISLAYRNAAGVVITQNCSSNVIFQSEVQGGPKPRMDGQIQDFTQNPYYYFVYDINTMLYIVVMWGLIFLHVEYLISVLMRQQINSSLSQTIIFLTKTL